MKLHIAIVTLSTFAGLTLGAVTQLGICPWINEKLATAWFDRAKEQLIQSRSSNDEVIALASFTRAIKLNPDFALAYVFRGLVESDRDAFADDSMAIKLNPKLSDAYNNRAYLKISRGDYDGAILDCNSAIELSPPGEQPYALRAGALANSGDWKGAIEDYTRAINSASGPSILVESYYVERGSAREGIHDKGGAMHDYDLALSLNPNNSEACLSRGRLRSDTGNKRGAIQDLDRAIALKPQFGDAYIERCWVRARLHDRVGADSDYFQADKLKPHDPWIKTEYGIALLALNARQQALQQFNDAIALDSNYCSPYVWRALTRLDMGDLKGAMRDLNKAVAVRPKSAFAHYRRGLLRLKLGDKISAKKDLKEALGLDPRLTDAAQMLAAL